MSYIKCEECVYEKDDEKCKDCRQREGLEQDDGGCGFPEERRLWRSK